MINLNWQTITSRNAVLLAITGVCLFTMFNLKSGNERWKSILSNDARGYYAYLPALIIYGDPTFAASSAIELTKLEFTHYRLAYGNGAVNKYLVGTAIAQLPFFLMAHTFAISTGNVSDGYTRLYGLSVAIAAIFYLIFGCFQLYHFLSNFTKAEKHLPLVIAFIVFGTNLFYYTVVESGMSHVYSFAFVALFVRYAYKALNSYDLSALYIAAIALAIIVLIRPVNILVLLFIPAFFKNPIQTFLAVFKNYKTQLFLPVLVMLLLMGVQPLMYFLSSGEWFVDSYPGEGFDFTNPHMWDFLFSFKKGLFVYAPVLAFASMGIFVIWKSSKPQAVYLVGGFLFLVYMLSSWTNWWYGGSFGSRVLVEYLVIFAFLLQLILDRIQTMKLKRSIIATICALALFTQFQSWQYRKGIIHWEKMNAERYWDVLFDVERLDQKDWK